MPAMIYLGRSKTLVLIVVLVLAGLALRLNWGLYGVEMFGVEEVRAQQGECPNPRLIDEITGSGNQNTAPFETTTDSFRISYEITAASPEAFFSANVESEDASNPIFDPGISQSGSGTGETFVNEDPGRYSLGIITGGDTNYTLRIEECGEGGEANPGEGKAGEGTTPQKTPPTPPKTPATPPKASPPTPKASPPAPKGGTLMEAGGPESGPAPKMPGGGCPQEYPTEKDGACYR